MKYLTAEEVLVIHARIIELTGGADGVRDVGLLESATARPRAKFGGKEQFRGTYAKAAAYLDSLARHHVFVDGNKRTAIATAARFLCLNGYELIASNKEVVKFVLKVATEKLDIEEIAEWFKMHSRKIANA